MEKQFINADFEFLEGLKNNLTLTANDNDKTNGGSSANSSTHDVEFVEKILNYKFINKTLLQQAFTDTSYDENSSYEHLEFIGDAVLNVIITKVLCDLYPDSPPGVLTTLRAVNVDTEKLARVALKHNLHLCLRHNKPLFEGQVLNFSKAIEEHPLHSRGLVKVPKRLADIVESTIGALSLDCNYSIETISEVVKPLLEPIITLENYVSHPMTQLHEMCQKKNLKLIIEEKTWESDKSIRVFVEDHLVGYGHHLIKKDSARNIAAKNAVDNFFNFFGRD